MAHFDFSSKKPEKSGRRTSKTKMIEDYLAKNVGKIINFAEVATELNVSTPTIYNFYNANRLYFKKVSRGSFEILDPKAERSK
jgi:signal recognition particle subunit SEC65